MLNYIVRTLYAQLHRQVHIMLKRYPMKTVAGLSPEEQSAWLDARWAEKDDLLRDFHSGGGRGYNGAHPLASDRAMASHLFVAAWLVFLAASSLFISTALPPAYWSWIKYAAVGFVVFFGVCFHHCFNPPLSDALVRRIRQSILHHLIFINAHRPRTRCTERNHC